MVSLAEVQESNARISSSFPEGLVAVFVGGTSGIGEMALKQFAKHTRRPRAYLLGRSQEAGDRITSECKTLNSEGEFLFVKADLSLIRTVDVVCRDLRSKEKAINLLFLTIGTGVLRQETSEGLHFFAALVYYARLRFIENLLPLLQQATDLRRVVNVAGGTKEGLIHINDFQARNLSIRTLRGHLTSMTTLAFETLARSAPDVSFVHEFPGTVKTDIGKEATGVLFIIIKIIFFVLGPFISVPGEESAARHLFIATSARYPPAADKNANSGVSWEDGAEIARGTTGESGSGVYSIDWDGESANANVEALLANLRQEGMSETVWDHTQGEFKRITNV
ncbi:hypothetical protein CPB83DRAFT_760417 [Crepidotus variabilis]|uniref:Uncharacterized protein n=1 Tax=Crepidotus variabilis TaxID=179855 RepID=A0A9P6EMW5_9AGAR|nr:hypothetical protein CPB83DRAFT_760417 [Crepidotus variabilis]